MQTINTYRGLSEVVGMDKGSHLGETLDLKHSFRNRFSHVLGSCTVFELSASESFAIAFCTRPFTEPTGTVLIICVRFYGSDKVTFGKGSELSVVAYKLSIALGTGIDSVFTSSLLFSSENLGI